MDDLQSRFNKLQVSGATGAKSKSTGSTPTRRLYHSTNEQGAKGIRKDKTIRESLDIGGDTAMGRGAYLHSLNPRKVSKQDLVRNNYDDGAAVRNSNLDKTKYYVSLNVPVDRVEKMPGPREVYRHKGEINIKKYRGRVYKKPE